MPAPGLCGGVRQAAVVASHALHQARLPHPRRLIQVSHPSRHKTAWWLLLTTRHAHKRPRPHLLDPPHVQVLKEPGVGHAGGGHALCIVCCLCCCCRDQRCRSSQDAAGADIVVG